MQCLSIIIQFLVHRTFANVRHFVLWIQLDGGGIVNSGLLTIANLFQHICSIVVCNCTIWIDLDGECVVIYCGLIALDGFMGKSSIDISIRVVFVCIDTSSEEGYGLFIVAILKLFFASVIVLHITNQILMV